jgi:hypothetical protein
MNFNIISKQSDQNEIQPIHSSCRDCVFARYAKDSINEQIDCKAGMIEKFEDIGIEIIPVYDKEKEFFVVNTVCMLRRPKEWDKGFSSNEERIAKARHEARIKYQVFVVVKYPDIDSLIQTINSIIDQKLPPLYITVLNPSYLGLNRLKTINLLQRTNIRWKLQNILQSDINVMKWINIVFQTCSFPFAGVFYSGIEIPDNTFSDIDSYINDELQAFLAMTPNSDGQGLIIPYTVYQHFNSTIVNKTFEEYLEENRCLTIPINKIVKNFPK